MSHRRLLVAAAILLCIIVVGFVLSVPHAREVPHTALSLATTADAPSITLHDTVKKGVHTLSGSIEAPNPCTTLSAEAALVGDASTTERITLALTMPADTGVCLQVPQTLSFSTTLAAPADLPIDVTLNGSAASTTAL